MTNATLCLTRFEPLGDMVIFGTYLRVGRGSEWVWLRGPKTSPNVPVIYGATSGGPNPKLMMTLKKLASPLNYKLEPVFLVLVFLVYMTLTS